jgi:molybdopterin molybdotransferase
MQEMAELQADGQVVFTQPVKVGRISAALAKISAGRYRAVCRQMLTAADLGLAASIGVPALTVYRPCAWRCSLPVMS